MKIVIEGDAHLPILARKLQNLNVFGIREACFHHMNGIPSFLSQDDRGFGRQSLIEPDALHAT